MIYNTTTPYFSGANLALSRAPAQQPGAPEVRVTILGANPGFPSRMLVSYADRGHQLSPNPRPSSPAWAGRKSLAHH